MSLLIGLDNVFTRIESVLANMAWYLGQAIWTRLFKPVYLDLSIWTCLFGPVYFQLSILTCLFGPVYLNPFILNRLFWPVYFDMSIWTRLFGPSIFTRLFGPVHLDLYIGPSLFVPIYLYLSNYTSLLAQVSVDQSFYTWRFGIIYLVSLLIWLDTAFTRIVNVISDRAWYYNLLEWEVSWLI